MHVNYQSVLHFNHCLVILLFEQLEIDSSLYDHKILSFKIHFKIHFFFSYRNKDWWKTSLKDERAKRYEKNPFSFLTIFSVVALKFRIKNTGSCVIGKTVKLWSQR